MRKNERKISRESRVRSNSRTFSRLNNAMCQEGCRAFNDDRQVRPPRFGGRADCANISRDPVLRMRRALRETRRRLHDTRHPCDGGDDDHCAMRGGTHPRGPRARLPQRGAAPQGARRPVSGHVEWRAPRALRPPARDDRERVRRPRSRVAAVERASTWALPRRAGWRRERAPPRASRGAPRAGRTREPNRGGASSRASREESRGGGERVRAKRGLRVHPQLLQPVSDRRHALATRFTPRRRLRAIYSASRLRDRADDALATRRFFCFFHEDETDATPPLPVFYARRRDYDLIRRECALLRTEVGSERRACARQRLGVMVDPTHVVHRAFMNRKVADRLGALTGESSLLPADVPVEFRVYPSGSCMDWHQDVALYVEPQYELVLRWRTPRTRRRSGRTTPGAGAAAGPSPTRCSWCAPSTSCTASRP